MNTQELKNRLTIQQGQFTLSHDTLTAAVSDLLMACYDGQPVVISQAQPDTSDASGETVRLTGRSNFLNVADLPVAARFNVDEKGEVHATLKYQLRDAAPGPSAWTFSRSFPQLPVVLDFDTEVPVNAVPGTFDIYANQRPFLDALDLLETYVVVSTHAGQDAELNVPLEPGINFVSKLRTQGPLGVFQSVLGDKKNLVLHGTIRLPKVTERTLPLQPLQFAWDYPNAPGIHLQAALDADFSLGKMAFNQALFRVYSPTTKDWLQKNNTFQPMHGYTGSLSVPSANINVRLGADLKWNLPEALLFGACEGITLGKLAHLMDMAGTDSLLSYLPQELQKAVDTLEKLELMHVALQMGLDGITPVIQEVCFTVGFPNLKWKVWGEHIEVEDLACRFSIANPFPSASDTASGVKPSVAVTMYGTLDIEGVPLAITAESGRGFALYARTQKAVRIPLDKLLANHAPDIRPPSALTVNHLGVSILPGRSYAMSTILAGEPEPWVIPVGKDKLTISDVLLNFEYPQGGKLQGRIAGKVAFDDKLMLRVGYDVPGGDFAIRGDFRRIHLSHLVHKLCDEVIPLPSGFDVVIEDASVLIQKRGDNYVFLVCSEVKDFGLFAFEVRKLAGRGWGFAGGLDMGGSTLSKLAGLSGLKVFEDSFNLQRLMLVVSSFADTGFQFPSMAQFNRPALATKNLAMPAQATGIQPGLTVFAQWQLRTDDRQHNLLMKLLGLNATQSAALAIGADPLKNSKLYVSSRGTLQGNPFVFQFGAELTNGKPSLFLMGSLTTKIQGQLQIFDVTLAFAPGGAFLSANQTGATAINCGPFKLSNLALEVGVDWAGIPSLGIAATIDVKKFESSVAVFFDSTDPSRSLVAGSISSLSLKDVMDTLLGGVVPATPLDEALQNISIQGTRTFTIPGELATDLDGLVFDKVSAAFASAAKIQIPAVASQLLLVVNQRGSVWHLTDLTTMRHYELKKTGNQIAVSISPQFYFAPQATAIGSARFPQGFYVNGALNVLGFKTETTVDISVNKGISIDAQMDKVTLVDEKLFCIAAEKGPGGPKLSVATFTQKDHPDERFRLPHFYVNGSLSLLGISRGVFASLTTHGLEFELNGPLLPGVNFDMDLCLGSSGLSAGGDIKVGVGTIDLGPLGKVKLNTDVEGELHIQADAKVLAVEVEARFEFAGEGFKIGAFRMDAQPNALTKLPEQLGKKVEQELTNAFKDMNKWANAVKNGLVDGVNDTAKVFKDVYGKSEQEAQALARGVGKGFNQSVQAVTNVANDTGKAVTSAANTTGKAVTSAANDTSKAVTSAAKDTGKAVSKGAKSVGKAFKKLF